MLIPLFALHASTPRTATLGPDLENRHDDAASHIDIYIYQYIITLFFMSFL